MIIKQFIKNIWPLLKRALPFILILLVWEILGRMEIWPPYFFPPLSKVAQTGANSIKSGILFKHLWASLGRLALALILGMGIGITLGLLMGVNRFISQLAEPLLNFFQSIAGIAWVPLALVWFGFGLGTITFVLFNTIFFPVAFNTLLGVKSVPVVYRQMVYTLGAKRKDVIFEVLLPGALPSIITGIRLGLGYGWRALIAAEMIASVNGVGFWIFDARMFFQTDVVLVGMLTIGFSWMLIDNLVMKPLERRTVERWGTVV